jgi:hypothetical protein
VAKRSLIAPQVTDNEEEIYLRPRLSPWVSPPPSKSYERSHFQLYTFFTLKLLDLERVKRLEP